MDTENNLINSINEKDEIAIVGMAGRFPDAKNIDIFWQNLQNGVESVRFFSDEELASAGVDSALLDDHQYVKAGTTLEDIELFDASFFDFTPRDAEITDPQRRIFIECVWQALENAGYDSETYNGQIGVFAGTGFSNYFLLNLYSNHDFIKSADTYPILIANDKDFLPTQISYKLNLKGPSINVQTTCSTSLVAVHLACQSLLNGESDIALAGGVSIQVPQKTGYLYQEGGILSPDGHCRAFDVQAQGTVSGNGSGVVVLKRLEDAVADGDCIHAVIKASAINNDGSLKVGYTAPSVDGQREVILEALALAGVEPETINYIEAHGTGTPLGDPIEIAALTQAFRTSTDNKGFCAIGSVKTNIGHLNAAAGVTGLIKTVLALKNKQIPPSLHFEQPNSQIDFENSPFYVNTQLSQWETNGTPRRAGVSSFGIGGTNAHAILEEAPILEASSSSRPWQLLLLSAKTDTALETLTANLIDYFDQHPGLNVADVAYTLQLGRRDFEHRRMLVCQNLDDANNALKFNESQRVFTHYQKLCDCSVVFMFSGQGSQYVNMGRELYESEPTFRSQIDCCSELLKPHIGIDLREVVFPNEQQTMQAVEQLQQTVIAQPALFVIEYALAKLWMSWGICPQAMIGHSIGEYVAATLAGVFSLEDALTLVANRAKLMQQLPGGAMLSVQLSEQQVQPLLEEDISLAAANGPFYSAVSGSTEAIEKLHQELQQIGVSCRRLHTSHAFHSEMMEPIIQTFTELLQEVKLNPPEIPFVSNVSGTWITTAEATNPNYWARHLRQTVRFCEGIAELAKTPERILLEVGPGRTLSTFAKQQKKEELVALTSLRHPREQQSDIAFLINTLGKLWLFGVKVDWSGFYVNERRYRVPLPSYPFERQRYWVEASNLSFSVTEQEKLLYKKPNIADWFYVPSWKRFPLPISSQTHDTRSKIKPKYCWLVFVDAVGIGSQIVEQLELDGHDVITLTIADRFTKLRERVYAINPQVKNDYKNLFFELNKLGLIPNAIAHFWNLTPNNKENLSNQFFEECQNLGFYSLLFLAQALGEQEITDALQIVVVTNEVHEVSGDEKLCPEKATVLGICKVIPQEYPNITCRTIDIVKQQPNTSQEKQLIEQILSELTQNVSDNSDNVVAYRSKFRWVQTFEPVHFDKSAEETNSLREGGVYLITGGLGGIGLVIAKYLAQTVRAKLILIGRSSLPPKQEWSQWLTTKDKHDDISHKIRKVQELETLGAEVLVCSADIGNLEQMQTVMSQSLEHFGQLHGVIHAAGIKLFRTVQQISKAECESQLHSAGHGLFVLEKILQDNKLDFCLLISSLASVVGVLGMAAYPSTHLLTDAFVNKHNQTSSVPWKSINYDNWQTEELDTKSASAADFKMTMQEGLAVFQNVLSARKLSQVVVSTADLQSRINKWTKTEFSKNSIHQKEASSSSSYSRPNLPNAYVAPTNQLEQILASIWQELLGFEQVGIHDNFFEMGGDSVLGIQVSARVAKAGFRLTPQQLFEYQTVAELAKVASEINNIQAEQGLAIGSLPLTPIQHWFFEQNQPQPHHWNQAVLLEVLQPLNPVLLEQALREILIHHDALRLRFTSSKFGWQQANADLSEEVPFIQVDLSTLAPEAQTAFMESTIKELQTSLNLSQGPVLRIALFKRGTNKLSRLLIVIHHLVVDFVSWRILLGDLQSTYEQISQSQVIQLPQKTTSYKQWSYQLKEYARSPKQQQNIDKWLSILKKQSCRLPIDFPEGVNTVTSVETLSVILNEKETQALLKDIPPLYRTNTQEILLTALVNAFAQWTGVNSLLVDFEGNGREAIVDDSIDLSRTVGWFTTVYPIVLDLEQANNPGEALKRVKEQLRSISNQGIDYGVLRYLSEDEVVTRQMRSVPQSDVVFLYIGDFDRSFGHSSLFRKSEEFSRFERSPQGTRSHLLEITGSIIRGQLNLDWKFSKNVHKRKTIEKLSCNYLNSLKSIITYCQTSKGNEYTPSDFLAAKIDEENLSNLMAQVTQFNTEDFE